MNEEKNPLMLGLLAIASMCIGIICIYGAFFVYTGTFAVIPLSIWGFSSLLFTIALYNTIYNTLNKEDVIQNETPR